MAKRVLVHLGGRSRPVAFTSSQSDSESDLDVLLKEIKSSFSDLLPRACEEEAPELFLQIQDDEWGSEYVDVLTSQSIPNKSILRVLAEKKVNLYKVAACEA